ncbi:TRAP transporter small permease subunit [Gilvimarinus sp. F26214L]|uniref:TRAP transporter small permease subunit n=1 Tax=Gilvimarinus sp. DZF01 TaxID=3461371 RepID=UPI0040467F53
MTLPPTHSDPPPRLRFLERLISSIDAFTAWTGRLVAWLTLLMGAITGIVVVTRYVLGLNSIALQESVIYMHAAVFMLGAAYTLQQDGHVRVDIFYRRFTPQTRAWVNSVGGVVFLLPICAFIVITSWDYVLASWRIREVSADAGGIPALFLLKSLIVLFALTLGAQAIAEVLRNLLRLMTGEPHKPGHS